MPQNAPRQGRSFRRLDFLDRLSSWFRCSLPKLILGNLDHAIRDSLEPCITPMIFVRQRGALGIDDKDILFFGGDGGDGGVDLRIAHGLKLGHDNDDIRQLSLDPLQVRESLLLPRGHRRSGNAIVYPQAEPDHPPSIGRQLPLARFGPLQELVPVSTRGLPPPTALFWILRGRF